VTRKITRGLARINEGLEECLFMGNLDSLRDWGHARDYVEMQWRMLQQPGTPQDFVIAMGRQESVRRRGCRWRQGLMAEERSILNIPAQPQVERIGLFSDRPSRDLDGARAAGARCHRAKPRRGSFG